jgi:exosome complex exonuclease RRP6
VAVTDTSSFNHPYASEIEHSKFPPPTYVSAEPIPWVPLAEQPVTFVDTEEGVEEMLTELKYAKELAVDLEHHDFHSYIGIVCLMQISTREKDWIVDTLKPWRESLQCLNEVFADPNILKVFHGSHEDMIWLQRDLGLYIVGLFDTYYACVALNFESRGLKYLLKRFADFDAQKKYQTADWRARPLPDEMMLYARSDTHYLLNIYDNLRNMLIESSTSAQDHLEYVLNESKKEALQRYERPLYDSETGLGSMGWYNALMRRNLKFDKEQLAVFRTLHLWRDTKAREKDEGVSGIMTAAQLWAISEAMPMTVTGLMGSTRPISKSISDHSKELVERIRKAKDLGKQGPPVIEILRRCEAKLEASGGSRPQPWRLPKELRQPKPDIGLGATVQMLLDEKNSNSEPIVTRALTSTLWGNVLAATATAEPPLPDIATEALRIILPLPANEQITFTDAAADEPSPAEPPASFPILPRPLPTTTTTTTTTASPLPAPPEPFVIRELARSSKKRTADANLSATNRSTTATSIPPATSSSPAALEASIDLELRTQRQLERKARKDAKLAAAPPPPPVVPFDYAGAESVLHAKEQPGEDEEEKGAGAGAGGGKAKGAKRPLDPYQKALDTGTGAKRARKETAGKSMTFH